MIKRSDIVYPEFSYQIMGVLFNVYNDIGPGYQEKHYQKALEVAFMKSNLKFTPQCPYRIRIKEK